MLFFVLASLALQAGSSTITLEEPCVAMPKLMEELSQQSGVALSVYGPPSKYDMAVRFDHVPLSEVMKRLAYVHAGEWIQRGEGYQLQRSAKAIDEERKANAKRLDLALRKQVGDLKKSLDTAPIFDTADAERAIQALKALTIPISDEDSAAVSLVQKLSTRNEIRDVAIAKLVVALSPSVFSGIAAGTRAVFAPSPTRMEVPMPAELMDVANEYVGQEKLKHEVEMEELKHLDHESAARFTIPFEPKERVLLSVSRSPLADIFTVTLLSSGPNGFISNDSQITIDLRDDERTSLDGVSQEAPKLTEREKLLLICLTKNGYQDHMKDSSVLAEVDTLLTHPERFAPGGVVTGPALLRSAKNKKVNFLAVLDDRFVDDSLTSMAKNQPLSEQSLSTKFEALNAWSTISPRDHLLADYLQMDRKAFGKLLQSAAANSVPSFDAEMEFAATSSEQAAVENPLTWRYAFQLMPQFLDCFDRRSYIALKLLSSLSAGQQVSFADLLSFKSLSPMQQDLVSRLTWEQDDDPYIDVHPYSFLEETLPDGVTSDGSLHVMLESITNFLMKYQTVSGRRISRFLDPDELATLISKEGSVINSVQPARMTLRTLHIQFSPTVSMEIPLTSMAISGDKVGSIDLLPQDFQAELKAALEKIKKEESSSDDGNPLPPAGAPPMI